MARPTHAGLIEGRTLVPVILGGDIGAYSWARAFHEAFGVKSILVTTTLNGVVRDSSIVINEVVPDADQADAAIATLQRIADAHPGADLIAMASAEWLVRILVSRRAELEPRYVVPFTDPELLERVTNKDAFAALCAEYGLDHPATVIADLADGPEVDPGDLDFPLIAKAGDAAEYHSAEFTGKEKVFTVASRERLDALMRDVYDAGYRGTFILQDLIPGDDSFLRISNSYVGKDGRCAFTVLGHILLQEHTPSTLGNSSAVLTAHDPDLVGRIEGLLEGIGWRGYATLDMKVDPRTGRAVFFELNPRASRSNYYATGSGFNVAVPLVREWVLGLPPLGDDAPAEPRPHLFLVVPFALAWAYLIDAPLRVTLRGLRLRGRVTNPLIYGVERHPRRWAYIAAAQLNQVRKYRRFYPRAVQRRERAAADRAKAAGADQA